MKTQHHRLEAAALAVDRLPVPRQEPAPNSDPWTRVAVRFGALSWLDEEAEERFAPRDGGDWQWVAEDPTLRRLCALHGADAGPLVAWSRRFLDSDAADPSALPSPAPLFRPAPRLRGGTSAACSLALALSHAFLRDGPTAGAVRGRWRLGDRTAEGVFPVAFALWLAAAVGDVSPGWWPPTHP